MGIRNTFRSWIDYSPVNNAMAAILGAALAGMGVALLLSALLKLGPAYRLLVAGASLVVVGVVQAVFAGVYLRSSVATVLSIAEAAAFFTIAGVLLGSALLAPSRRVPHAHYATTPQWPQPQHASGVPVGDPVPAPRTPEWPPQAWPPPAAPPAPSGPVS